MKVRCCFHSTGFNMWRVLMGVCFSPLILTVSWNCSLVNVTALQGLDCQNAAGALYSLWSDWRKNNLTRHEAFLSRHQPNERFFIKVFIEQTFWCWILDQLRENFTFIFTLRKWHHTLSPDYFLSICDTIWNVFWNMSDYFTRSAYFM